MGDHQEHGQDQDDPAVAEQAARLLDALRARLDPPAQRDIRGKQADARLRKAAQLARQRARRARQQQ